MLNIRLITSIFILALYSCHPQEEGKKIIRQIPESGTLKSSEVSLANAALMPYKIVASADKAVVLDQGKENLFKVYTLPDFSFQYAFGDIGEGPDEFQFVNGNSLKIHGEHLVVLSGTQLIKIKLHAEKATREAQHTLISDTGGPINGLHLVNDSVYVADIGEAKPGAPEHRLVHLGRNEELVRFGKYPKPAAGENKDQANLSRDYMKSTVANPKDGSLAVFYLYHNQIRLYSGDGELLQQIEVKSSSNSSSDEEMWIYRADPFASSEHIYVLYVGMPKKEVEENFETFRPYLEVWDWEGNLLDRFRLDQPITTFTYAEEFKKLYGISFFKEDVLYEYDLNEGGITDFEKESSAGKGKNSKQLDPIRQPDKKIIAENAYFRIEPPAGWNYPPSWTLEEKKSVGERDGLYLTGAAFVRENPADKSVCGASMQLTVGIPKEEPFDVDEYLSSRADGYRSNDQLNELSIEELANGIRGYTITYKRRFVDPKGEVYLSTNEHTLFEREGRIIVTRFTSCDFFERYKEVVRKAFESLTLKDAMPG
ncbi:TolB-like 6-bladed beta-propeller domain-containing protein [Cyclobacterium salsum]|uniref:hypothetical protein n=1 Tax=Cyclobacterium salsum TaxID=2666329 RepID=UPI0013911D63|nr:hypothetical protein [Cyclobacterium salsum]